ncbi:hypothetical protein Ac2012v2_004207 [Leucoagaricus gongylophorus]
MKHPDFDHKIALAYLGLPLDYEPSPTTSTIQFLRKHLSQLPPNIVCKFSSITTPKVRTTLTPIRNRRLRYVNTHPSELDFVSARHRWPELWEGRERRGAEEGLEEKRWVWEEFLKGEEKHVGKLASLLGGYEEEREAERIRAVRRELAETTTTPEEEVETESEDAGEEESEEEKRRSFERIIRERFIYGLLPGVDYDEVDYDENLDVEDDRETQDRWFDDD